MKRLECDIFFYDKLWAKVYTVEPFEKIIVEGVEKLLDENSILDRYLAMTDYSDEEPELIQREEKPLKFVAYLYQGLSGSYMRASESRLVETDEIQKEEEPIELDIPNLDYLPETTDWIRILREENKIKGQK